MLLAAAAAAVLAVNIASWELALPQVPLANH
jgi:hypothetical protein